MLKSLLPVFYVQLSPSEISVLNVNAGARFSDVPEIALAQGNRAVVLAVGRDARQAAGQPGVVLASPFGHPRSLVSDFVLAELIIKHCVAQVADTGLKRLVAPSPRMVIHPLGEPEGGYTQVEIRALRELGIAAGAALVTVWQGPRLTDEALRSGQFPSEGQVLA